MDPKNLSQLDPKLREVYERVMGTQTTPTSPQNLTTQAAPPPPPQIPTSEPPPMPLLPAQPVDPPAMTMPSDPVVPPPPPPPDLGIGTTTDYKPNIAPRPLMPDNGLPPLNVNPTPTSNVSSTESTIPAAGATPPVTETKTKKMMPVLIGVLLVVFLVVWAFLWVVILGVKTPFSG